jgi:hypothetical protein
MGSPVVITGRLGFGEQNNGVNRSLGCTAAGGILLHCERSKLPWINTAFPVRSSLNPNHSEDSMSVGELTILPDIGDAAYYRAGTPHSRKLLVIVTEIFKNGRIKVTFPDGSWKSLPRHYHKRVQNQRYGLVRIE